MQLWMLWLGIGLPLLGALAGGFCAMVKVRADGELSRRAALATVAQVEQVKSVERESQEHQNQQENELRAQLEQTGKQAAELEERTRRQITPDARAKFIDELEFFPKGRVRVHIHPGADAETTAFANQIRDMLAAAGYDAGNAVDVGPAGKFPQGIFMSVGHQRHPFAGAIQQALGVIGISATGYIDNSVLGDELRIDVGTKP